MQSAGHAKDNIESKLKKRFKKTSVTQKEIELEFEKDPITLIDLYIDLKTIQSTWQYYGYADELELFKKVFNDKLCKFLLSSDVRLESIFMKLYNHHSIDLKYCKKAVNKYIKQKKLKKYK